MCVIVKTVFNCFDYFVEPESIHAYTCTTTDYYFDALATLTYKFRLISKVFYYYTVSIGAVPIAVWQGREAWACKSLKGEIISVTIYSDSLCLWPSTRGGEVVVTEWDRHCVSVFSPSGD